MIELKVLKRQLKIDDDQIADDGLILQMEAAAVTFMQNETGLYFGPVSEITDVLSSNGYAPIWLHGTPLLGDEYMPFSLERRSSPAGTWEVVATTDYEVDGARLYPLTYWLPARRNLRATYWSGFEETEEAPADIRQKVRELVTLMYEHRQPFIDGTITTAVFGLADVIRANKVTVV
jgi:hypothetical protein